MRRTIGLLLVMHALAHVGAAMWLSAGVALGTVSALSSLAMAGFLAAGIGLLGVQPLDRRWRFLAGVGALASLALLALRWNPILMIGAAIDGAILLDAIPFAHEIIARTLGVPEHPSHRRLTRFGAIVDDFSTGAVPIQSK